MTLDEAASLCLAAGFTPHDQVGHFGEVIPYVRYLSRGLTYVSLTGYEGEWVEGCHEAYLAPKNTRRPKGRDITKPGDLHSDHQKRGFIHIKASLPRTRADLEAAISLLT